MNIKYNKKEKSITLQVEVQKSTGEVDIEDDGDLTESFALITENLIRKNFEEDELDEEVFKFRQV